MHVLNFDLTFYLSSTIKQYFQVSHQLVPVVVVAVAVSSSGGSSSSSTKDSFWTSKNWKLFIWPHNTKSFVVVTLPLHVVTLANNPCDCQSKCLSSQRRTRGTIPFIPDLVWFWRSSTEVANFVGYKSIAIASFTTSRVCSVSFNHPCNWTSVVLHRRKRKWVPRMCNCVSIISSLWGLVGARDGILMCSIAEIHQRITNRWSELWK